MQTINVNFNINLLQVLNSIQHCLISNDTGDACYQLTKFEQDYDDESSIHILTYGINQHQEVDLKELSRTLAEYLPQEIRDAFIKEEHIILIKGNASLAIHFNDATITCILHFTGQW